MRYLVRFGVLFVLLAGCSRTQNGNHSEHNAEAKKTARVLIVTGIDYPGHKWQLTAPVLAEAIGADNLTGSLPG